MTAMELYERAKYFFPPPPPPEFAACDAAKAPRCPGVYFIYDGDQIVYVGESICVGNRLANHPHATSRRLASVIRCDTLQRKRLEAFYIGLLNPRLNRESTSRCQAVFSAASTKSLVRRIAEYVARNPGCSLSDLRGSCGWKIRASVACEVICRMTEWKFLREEIVKTKGRPRRVYFLAASEAVA